VAPNSLTAFPHEGILFAIKTWNDSLVIFQAGLMANLKIPGNLFHCGYTANVYRVVGTVVQLYTAGNFEDLAELHNQLVRYTTRERGNKVPYFIPSLVVRLMTRIPLNTMSLQTHREGSKYIDVEPNSSLFAALQTTSHIFGRTFNSICITPFIMQRLIAFSDEMKAKEAFQPFTVKLTARAGSMRALPYTAGGPEMVPCARPPDIAT